MGGGREEREGEREREKVAEPQEEGEEENRITSQQEKGGRVV